MNTSRSISPRIAAMMATFILGPSPPAFSQGSLTPPGAPAPTMKTLDQIESRTPISSLPSAISAPGSYYLMANLETTGGSAINISADGVTLDLNGFTITSTTSPAGGAGIRLSGTRRNVAIFNGNLQGGGTNTGGVYSGPGFLMGIDTAGTSQNVRVTGVNVMGCQAIGINLGTDLSTVVTQCTVRTVGNQGISAGTVTDSVVSDSNSAGINAKNANNCTGIGGTSTGLFAENASNCKGSSNSGIGLNAGNAQNCTGSSTNGTGISTGNGGKLIGCTAKSSAVGIAAGIGSTIKDCTAYLNTGNGISAGDGSVIQGCSARENSGNGILVGAGCSVIDCAATRNILAGIRGTDNCIIRGNTCQLNGISTGSAGIRCTGNLGNGNRIEGNNLYSNGLGIKVEGSANLIIKNSSSTAFPNTAYDIVAGNNVGPIVSASGDLSGIANGNHPWANFIY
ncbi:MAG: hypothetical protein V4819_11925 [Verrucomicrobiota bacterium]